MVGEFIKIDRITLMLLVDGTLSPSSHIYNDLKSKHFIKDNNRDVGVDLLSLKYRTKKHRVSQFTSLHIFVVTLRCDYTCKYCQVSRRLETVDAFEMTHETAINAIKLMFMSPSKYLKVEFQGGEPLLNFKLIEFIVNSSLEINRKEKRDLQFVIATNLSYLDEKVIDFCDRYGIYISTSLDGPEELHNQNRPKAGKDGYQKTVAGIRKIQNCLGEDRVSALMTTTAPSLSKPKEIVDEYVKQGLHSIFLRPISPYGFAIKTKQVEKYNIDNWMKFYRTSLDYIIKLNIAGYYLSEQYTSIILRKIFTPSDPGYVDLQSPAGTGISAVVYNYDGDVYASDEARMLKEMGDESFKLGNVNTNSYSEIFGSDVLLDLIEYSLPESSPMCSECGLLAYCGADPVYHHTTQADIVGKKPLSFFCNKNMAIIDHIFSLLEDEESLKVLEGWIN